MDTTKNTPVMRFLTLGGAHVAVMNAPGATSTATHTWQCLGCDQGNDYAQPRTHARQEANRHAAGCRSIPKTTD
ncbi:hypothetical protein [Spirillospora sp. CA-128828]|uniref:hypothetical protein n=1 Tax=Spirillospora sp. CA-128828 TaxID=3240033 RepID=UPI003D8DF937